MKEEVVFSGLLMLISLVVIFLLSRPILRNNEKWQAMLTPLSSIVGSGFLIMAPLLASIVGKLSPLAVLGIVLLAYGIGHVIRFNIKHIEPRINNDTLSKRAKEIEYIGNVVLVLAYMVAVAFYLSLLSSFSLNYLGIENIIYERWMTTGIIIFIAVVGYIKGLSGLEKLESLSMTVQLSIVVALLIGLGVFGMNFLAAGETLEFVHQQRPISTQIQMLAGALLVVQGFETSRFIGEKYSTEVRVTSMRNAQIISGILYVVSVILFMPIVQEMNLMHIELADIIAATGSAALILPLMLMVAAVMSQFSAAIADTGGAGGLLNENSNQRLSTKMSYVGVSVCAILLVWSVDLLEIIALASKAFATYYLSQTLLALYYCHQDCPIESRLTLVNKILYIVISIILLYVIFFAIPAE
ncbi:MAG: hypothetical protein Ctma_1393 [Catillopecten margaritatus gill symbiont]|uniref:Uncharacterized protein n=1 Tax=Catillopecten margaritatus gill symbiont TaxID=3083288 RepID=A0AAU6PI03_9GAMM